MGQESPRRGWDRRARGAKLGEGKGHWGRKIGEEQDRRVRSGAGRAGGGCGAAPGGGGGGGLGQIRQHKWRDGQVARLSNVGGGSGKGWDRGRAEQRGA